MRRRRGAVAAATAVLACAVAGCSPDEDSPAPSPQSSPSTSEASAPAETAESPPAETPPPLPPQAQVPDADGAAAFIRHYFDVVNYAYRTGDVAALGSLEAADCKSCASANQSIGDTYARGGTIEGGALSVDDVVATPGPPGTALEVRAVISQAEGAYLDKSGVETKHIASEADFLLGAIVRFDETWKLLEWGDADELL